MTDNKPRANLSRSNLIEALVEIASKFDTEQLTELYNWSREPDLLKITRAISRMSPSDRKTLQSFFSMAGDPVSVRTSWESTGRLSLESPDLGKALETVGHFLEDPALPQESDEKNTLTEDRESSDFRSCLRELDEYIIKNGRLLTVKEEKQLYNSMGNILG